MKLRQVILAKPLRIDVEKLNNISRLAKSFGVGEKSAPLARYTIFDKYDNQILGFEGPHNEKSVTKISSELSPKQLSYYFSTISPKFSIPIIKALEGTGLEVPDITLGELLEFKEKGFSEYNQNRVVDTNAIGKFTSRDAVGILFGNVGLTDANSDKPILGTISQHYGIAIALYNPKTKTAALVDIPLTDPPLFNITRTLKRLRTNQTEVLEAHLRVHGSSDAYNDTLYQLKQLNYINIKSNTKVDVGERSLAIDARNGKIYTKFELQQLTINIDLSYNSLNLKGGSIHVSFDGTGDDPNQAKPIRKDYSPEPKVTSAQAKKAFEKDLADTLKDLKSR
jgi:hypothetical protein